MLKTLGYRMPADRIDELIGEVYVHRWSDAFADAWAQLPRGTFDDGARAARLPPTGHGSCCLPWRPSPPDRRVGPVG